MIKNEDIHDLHYSDFHEVTGDPVMLNGQQWFDRFTEEVGDITQAKAHKILDTSGAAGIYDYMVAAAKRASGLVD